MTLGPPPAPVAPVVCVTGGRDTWLPALVFKCLWHVQTELVGRHGPVIVRHGACQWTNGKLQGKLRGVDLLAELWAERNQAGVEQVPVTHALDGPWPGAGPRRNRRMLERGPTPRVVLSFPGGTGTKDCTDRALSMGLDVRICALDAGGRVTMMQPGTDCDRWWFGT